MLAHDPGGRSKPKWPAHSRVSAWFSDCGQYRYSLSEVWDADRPTVCWLMMNPSVAGIEHADPTLIKTGKFSRRWGYGSQVVCNVHAYRATDCKRLSAAADPIGPENDLAIVRAVAGASLVMLAYGRPPKPLRPRAELVMRIIADTGTPLAYLRLSIDGTPYHPLYLSDHSRPIPWIAATKEPR